MDPDVEQNEPVIAGKVERQRSLPMKDAVSISWKNIKIRFARSMITTSSIILGIAFLSSIFTSVAVDNAVMQVSAEKITTASKASQIWLVILSLLVCGVGITNAMMMAVTERYKDIATMKCLGALNRFILKLFLIESGFQGLLGSLIGAIAGTLLMLLLSAANYGMVVFETLNVSILKIVYYNLISVGIGIVLAVVAAIYPAYRASVMSPTEAMRVEV